MLKKNSEKNFDENQFSSLLQEFLSCVAVHGKKKHFQLWDNSDSCMLLDDDLQMMLSEKFYFS